MTPPTVKPEGVSQWLGEACLLVGVERASECAAQVLHGETDAQPVLPVPGEVFALRKLLPQTADHDFNVHVMDFQPGEYLFVKEARPAPQRRCR